MDIPKHLPQFEQYPVLFISSGEYEAHFYVASDGTLVLQKNIKMAPREEAKEKQGFVGKKGGMKSLSAVSRKGRYVEDLKKKFQKKIHAIIHEYIIHYKLNELYICAPRYVTNRILKGLNKAEQKKVKMKFLGEKIKYNPLQMVEEFWNESEKAKTRSPQVSNEEKKILKNPLLRKRVK